MGMVLMSDYISHLIDNKQIAHQSAMVQMRTLCLLAIGYQDIRHTSRFQPSIFFLYLDVASIHTLCSITLIGSVQSQTTSVISFALIDFLLFLYSE